MRASHLMFNAAVTRNGHYRANGAVSQGFNGKKVDEFTQSSGAVRKWRWTSWATVPNTLTVSVDVRQHFSNNEFTPRDIPNVLFRESGREMKWTEPGRQNSCQQEDHARLRSDLTLTEFTERVFEFFGFSLVGI